jgi:hypothetical protein
LTKPLHEDACKAPIDLDDLKPAVEPKMLDNTLIATADITPKPKARAKAHMVKPKAAVKKTSRLSKATACLFDLEDATGPEKPLNIDFGLYQMENY